jgi:small nuclear ribonucleoprotein (snRNP)-like protein
MLTVGFGRLATGVLKGYDALMNLVLDEVEELLRGERTPPSLPPSPLGSGGN